MDRKEFLVHLQQPKLQSEYQTHGHPDDILCVIEIIENRGMAIELIAQNDD